MKEKKDSLDLDDEDIYDEDDEDSQKDKYLTFCIASEDYGIEIRHVTEIIGIQKITEIPDMPEYINGVINLRGKVIPVMDVRARFHIERREYDDRTCIVVVNVNEDSIGFVVDTVKEVVNIPANMVEPPPKSNKSGGGLFVNGLGKVGDEVKILLNVEQLIFDAELNSA